ncbi:MAG: matrixin family metalloprotease, partial [Ignavibacteriaceae bacterium]|nr:matrixin family metalloprotease [Ignavibacteriaceae bacterium]
DRGEEPSYIFQVGKFYEAGGPLGLTDIFINTSDEIIKAETYVNKYYWFTIDPNSTEYDIQSHVLHEFGHWLRLLSEEDFGCIENVMYKYLFQGEVKRNLTQDDKNGIVYIYGQNPIIQLTINPLKDRQKYFFEYGPEVLSYILENIEKNKILESINKEGE